MYGLYNPAGHSDGEIKNGNIHPYQKHRLLSRAEAEVEKTIRYMEKKNPNAFGYVAICVKDGDKWFDYK